MKAKQQFKENFTVQNRFGYLSPETILLDGIKDVKKAKTTTVACITFFVNMSLPSLRDYDVSFSIFSVFSRTQTSKIYERAKKGATREEKRVALVTFLVGGDFTRSLKVGTTRFLQCTLAVRSSRILKSSCK